jgi:[protein-PII] uridylyltransferase
MTLLEKIEADAAARLRLPAGRTAAQELARFKTFLKVETHRIKMLHRSGGGGLEVCRARAAILDAMVRQLWETARSSMSAQAQKEFPPLALVATGGYGRAELNPHSDVDVMFLHAGQVVAGNKPLPHLSRMVDGILYPLWDVGLKVAQSVRSIEDCVNEANGDMQSKTALIEARLIAGDARLFEKFQKTLMAKCVTPHVHDYISMRVADQNARRAKFGNSACMQEPHLKNGCGGLRDFQNLLWMAFFKYGTRALGDLQARQFISATERKQLETAYDFLLRVRTEMHYHVNRPCDVLSKNLQPAVAHNLGYKERSPSQRLERFMRDLYTHSRNIYLITRTIEERLALQPPPPSRLASLRAWLPARRTKPADPVDGFRFENGQIHATSNRVFRDHPRRLMRVFLHAQLRGLRLHPDLAQLIRTELALVNREFLTDHRVGETFLSILDQRGNVSPTLRAMHEVGLLGKYVPEFGKLTCLVQHEFFHQYTADEHTLMCLEQLDRIWEASEAPHQQYVELFQHLEQPYLLYLALLLHDTGKPEGRGRHAEAGGQLAQRVAKRLGLDANATLALHKLIEHHLLMAIVSQRRDLEDPAEIRKFAEQVGDLATLDRLTLLTFVDAQATSDKLWNGFKDALLRSLYEKARPVLSGDMEFVRAAARQREVLQEETRQNLSARVSAEELRAHFMTLPARYFEIRGAHEIALDLALAHRFMHLLIFEEDRALEPIVGWQDDSDRGYTAVKVCTWDREGLFSHIAGALSAAGLNILSAQIFTRSDGIAMDTFYVTDARTGVLASEEQQQKFEALLAKVLTGHAMDFRALIARQRSGRPLYQGYEGEGIPTRLHLTNDASDHRTLIEVETEDHIGLLHVISQTISALRLDISAAKICTERGAAMDSFYVTELGGGSVRDPERLKHVERKLRQAIHSLEQK